MASNGIGDLGQYDFMNKGMYPGSQLDRSSYATPSQVPLGAQAAIADYDPKTNPLTGEPVTRFAQGGIATLRYEEGGDIASPEETKPPTMGELAEQIKYAYRSNQDYEDLWKQFAATKEQDPQEWYRKELEFLGGQQGWQIGQNTEGRNEALMPQLTNTMADAKAAGLSDDEITNILGASKQQANIENQNRIAEEAAKGQGWVNQNIPGGWTTVAALAAAAAAPYALPAMGVGGGSAGALTTAELMAGAGGAFVPAAGSGASFMLPAATTALGSGAGALTTAELMGGAGGAFTPTAGSSFALAPEAAYTLAGPAAGSGSWGLSPELASELGLSGSTSGLSTSGAQGSAALEALGLNSGAGGLTTKQLMAANMGLKTLSGAMGGGESTQGGYGSATSAPAIRTTQQPYISPTMLAQPKYGELYRPYTYDYGIRRAAQGGVMYAIGGGISTLGSFSDGGRLLKGPGDGMSDDIPASIGETQPAALADGEFVIPADVVSHLGNGSTDAGAKQLYKMMDKIRHARTGNSKQGKQINPNKFLPKG
jgi:hypothetical protein